MRQKRKLKLLDGGTILEVYRNGEAYEIEFMDKKGRTIEVVTLFRTKEKTE
mgnify:CR=1 FL=1